LTIYLQNTSNSSSVAEIYSTILACDGVWDVISNEEAAACVRASRAGGAAPADAAAALIRECLERGSSDNMTAIVAILADEGAAAQCGGAEGPTEGGGGSTVSV
jgi:serine/threonine protein phosphatase PrpC